MSITSSRGSLSSCPSSRQMGSQMPSPASQPDPSQTVVLIRDAEAGDEEAFRRLYRKNRDWLRTSAALLIGDQLAHVEVADLLQDTFAYAFRRIQDGEFELAQTEGAFRRYLGRVLRSKAVDQARRAKAKKRGEGHERAIEDLYSSTLSQLVGVAAADGTPSQNVMGAELAAGVKQAIARLSEQDRRILHYRLVCGMHYDEILPHLAMVRNGEPVLDDEGNPVPVTKVGTAKSMFSRARQKLLEKLKERGLVEEAGG